MRSLSLATIFAAASGFIVLIVAAGALGSEGYNEFQAYWALFFALTGCIDGVMQETTRAVSVSRETGRRGSGRPWRLGGLVAVIVLVAVLLTGALWIGLLLSEQWTSAVGLMAFGLASYSFQAVLSGILSGLGLWNQYAWLLALDSGIRLLLAVLAWAAGLGMWVYILLTVIGAASWLVVLAASPTARQALAAPIDVSGRALARRAGSAMLASGASAALITGFPVFVQATSTETAGAVVTISGIMMAVTLTRAPILVPLQRFQSALIVRFVEHRDRIYSALVRPVAAVLGLGVFGGVLAWLIGPWILRMLPIDQGFEVPGLILAILTFASACTGSLMITGAATLAVERHRPYVAGWMSASVIAFATLMLPLPLHITVCIALILGPVVGGGVHAAALRGASRSTTAVD